jgi:hypothetical protein
MLFGFRLQLRRRLTGSKNVISVEYYLYSALGVSIFHSTICLSTPKGARFDE